MELYCLMSMTSKLLALPLESVVATSEPQQLALFWLVQG